MEFATFEQKFETFESMAHLWRKRPSMGGHRVIIYQRIVYNNSSVIDQLGGKRTSNRNTGYWEYSYLSPISVFE
jgi:hypothetical protein